jgi:flagellar P-ring protein precursor FlgI
MLERLGVAAAGANLNTRNVAAVMVTANLPPFASQGSRIDVTVSALGDARSLAGGQLLVTPLMGADQQVYAVAQGPLAIGGFAASGQSGSSVTRGVPTAALFVFGHRVPRSHNRGGDRALGAAPNAFLCNDLEKSTRRHGSSLGFE